MNNVLITGCSSGIGLAAAKLLKEKGYNVFATARDASDVEMLRGLGFDAVQMDVASSDSIVMALNWVFKKTDGKLSALVNNAAFAIPGAIEDLTRSALVDQFETGFFGIHELTTLVLPAMRRQGHGKIIQISSVLGLVSMPYRGAYSSMKYALEGWTDALRQEVFNSGIAVSLIEPGPINSSFRENARKQFELRVDKDTSMHAKSYLKMLNRLESDTKAPFSMPPEAVAEKIAKIIDSKKPKPRYYVTRATWYLGLLKRVLSTAALDAFLRKVARKETSHYHKNNIEK